MPLNPKQATDLQMHMPVEDVHACTRVRARMLLLPRRSRVWAWTGASAKPPTRSRNRGSRHVSAAVFRVRIGDATSPRSRVGNDLTSHLPRRTHGARAVRARACGRVAFDGCGWLISPRGALHGGRDACTAVSEANTATEKAMYDSDSIDRYCALDGESPTATRVHACPPTC